MTPKSDHNKVINSILEKTVEKTLTDVSMLEKK